MDEVMYGYHIGDMQQLIGRTPNLEYLYAVDGAYKPLPPPTEPWYVSLPKLRHLSTNDLDASFGADEILRRCPSLESLVYGCDASEACLLPQESLDIVRSTLWSLSYSFNQIL